jgi:hypothetical protein
VDRHRTLLEFVLEAVANDYESLECIVEQTTKLAQVKGFAVTRAEITRALRQRIHEKYIQPYLLSSQPPYSQKVEFYPDRIDELWFYVTPKGKKLVSSFKY